MGTRVGLQGKASTLWHEGEAGVSETRCIETSDYLRARCNCHASDLGVGWVAQL